MSTTDKFDYVEHVRSGAPDRSKMTRGPEERRQRHASVAKERVTIRLDSDVVESFKQLTGNKDGKGYQTLMNHALREWLRTKDVQEMIREEIRAVLREEFASAKASASHG